MDGTVLVADDDRSIRTVLTQALTRAGCRVHATGSLAQLLRWVEEGRGDLVITDVVMPDGNGIETIPALRRARPDLPVIVISAQNTIVTAIRATEADAFDYLPKPFDLHELMARTREGLERKPRRAPAVPAAPSPLPSTTPSATPSAAPAQNLPLAPEAGAEPAPDLPLVGRSPVMQALFRQIARVLNADLPVLVAGEAGAGRSTVARVLHDLSAREGHGLAVLTAAGISDEALSGAGNARAGSVIIEDPAGMSAADQARLAAAIEGWERTGPLPRLIGVTGPDPAGDVEAGRLRADLYYRLAGLVLTVPPLRARLDDIPELARHLLARADAGKTLPDEAAALIRRHPFPGNLRELDQLMRRLALTAAAPRITADEAREALPPEGLGQPLAALSARPARGPAPRPPVAAQTPADTATPDTPAIHVPLREAVEAHLQRYFDLHGDALPPAGLYDRVMEEVERPLLELSLDATGGNQLRCAELLGINRNTLRKKLTDLNIEVTRRRRVM